MADPATTLGGILAAIVKTAPEWIPAILGSAISLRFIGREKPFLERLFIFVSGATIAIFAGPAIVEWQEIGSGRIQHFLIFASGVAGLAATQAAVTEIPKAVESLREKFTGSKS